MTDEPLLTRDQIVECARRELGIPLTKSRIEKDSMNGVGPQPASCYGKTMLYTKQMALAYARTLISPVAA